MAQNGRSDNLVDAAGICAGAAALVVGTAAFAFFWNRQRTASNLPDSNDFEGMTVCITGGNVGIGRAVAESLGKRGARILMGCRNMEQAKQVCDRIGTNKCHSFHLDLADSASIESFSKSIINDTVRSGLHVLINNAGAMVKEEDRDAGDGWDRSMVVNHLGWVQLTRNLLPLLEKTTEDAPKPIRIVNVGSLLEKQAKMPLRLEDPNEWDHWLKESPIDPPYSPFRAYANAKLAMTAATLHWARILEERQPSTSSRQPIQMILISPGMVNTSLPRFMPLWKRVLSYPLRVTLLKSPEQAAETVLFAATSPNAQAGKYYRTNRKDVEEIQDTDRCSEAAKSPEIGRHILEATFRVLETRKSNQTGVST